MEKIKAVFVGDSKRFHKFQLATGNIVGTIYVPKEGEMAKEIGIELVSKAHPDFERLSAELEAKKL